MNQHEKRYVDREQSWSIPFQLQQASAKVGAAAHADFKQRNVWIETDVGRDAIASLSVVCHRV